MKTTAFNSPEKRKLGGGWGGRERGREGIHAPILRYNSRLPGLMRTTRLATSHVRLREAGAKGGGWGEGGSHRMEKSRFHHSLRSFPQRRGYSSLNVLTVSPPSYF